MAQVLTQFFKNQTFCTSIPPPSCHREPEGRCANCRSGEHFSLPGGRAAEPFLLDIALQPLEAGGELVLRNVFLASGSAALDERSRHELQRLFDLLQDQPTLRIRIGGHTDDVGTETDNQRLSEARARAVRDYLVDAGVAPERLEYRGYGESRPLQPGNSEAARALNRRTTVEVLE